MEFSVLRNKNDSSSYDANMFGHVRRLTGLCGKIFTGLAMNPHESLPAVSLIELRINKSIIYFIYLINIQNYANMQLLIKIRNEKLLNHGKLWNFPYCAIRMIHHRMTQICSDMFVRCSD